MTKKILLLISLIVILGGSYLIYKTSIPFKSDDQIITYTDTSLREIIIQNKSLVCNTGYASGLSGFKATIYIKNQTAEIEYKGSAFNPETESTEITQENYSIDLNKPDNKNLFDIDNQYFTYKCTR
ncbi:MAG: hypothetical protein K8Q91_03295 [Candidatus Vogelbacteria bacterium]|nr:hypothetical protein [Candidatus Vogelbacteria bacterium]